MKKPYVFDEFFAKDLEESVSPFITSGSRHWGKNLPLKSAFSAAILLVLSFSLSFVNASASYLSLSFVYFLVGIPALIAAIEDLKNLELNIDVLMTLAAFLAILIDSSIEGALLLVLFSLSHALEDTVSKKAQSALHNLNHLAPKFATLVDIEGNFFEKSVREIQIGDVVIVKNGEIVPLDGKIVKGSSSLNLVHLTGESLPILKTEGDLIPAGARNLESSLWVEVTRISSDSTLTKIIQLIMAAHEAKPRLQTILDRFGKHYATAIISLTFLFALTFPWILSISYFGMEGSIYRALSFLIAASPCALIIATPTAYLSAISACAKKGVLLKGGITLDALARCRAIALDKTGTLTTGELSCVNFEPFSLEALSIAYGLEQHVMHPIASAISKFAAEKKVFPKEIKDFKAVPGFGLEGTIEGRPIAIGLPKYIASKTPLEKQQEILSWAHKTKEQGQMLAVLLFNEEIFYFQFSDQLRKGAIEAIEKIKKKHQLNPVLLTGDHWVNAKAIGKELGIEEIYADLRPEDKLEKVAEISKTRDLAMVGDGVNDAPALARAAVGISMGKIGSATAVDASDVVLLHDDLLLLPWLFSKSLQTKKIIQQNLTLALSVIFLATTPALLGLVPLWLAVVLHEGGTVLVGCNSLRLLRK